MVLYRIGSALYFATIHVFSLFNDKARLWVQGRKDWYNQLKNCISSIPDYYKRKKVWIHVSSLGEFEQGRPVLETIKKEYPNICIILTFFSPSGYEVRKSYPLADIVAYLPADTPANAEGFLNLVQPDLAIWVKYDFWYYFLQELRTKNIPTVLIAAVFRKNSVFEKGILRNFYRNNILPCFTRIFVQDKDSARRLAAYYPKDKITIAGDTRYDRVIAVASQYKDLPILPFDGITLVAGSTWSKDESLLSEVYQKIKIPLRIIIAPHEIHEAHLKEIERKFNYKIVRYSQLSAYPESRLILVDNFGLLSTLYRYGQVAYIGNGFGKHIHNLLEASVYGIPTIFGPRHHKAIEAKEHIQLGVSKEVHSAQDIITYLEEMYQNSALRNEIRKKLHEHFAEKKGAVDKIIQKIRFLI